MAKNYQWFNFGGDPEGILDSESLKFSLAWALRENAVVAMVLAPGEQHGTESRFLGHM